MAKVQLQGVDTICVIFCQFHPDFAYKSFVQKKACNISLYVLRFPVTGLKCSRKVCVSPG